MSGVNGNTHIVQPAINVTEKRFEQLLERILLEAKALCNADGGTLYLHTDDEHLQFVIMHNDSLHITLGGARGAPIPFTPLSLYDPVTGEPNHHEEFPCGTPHQRG